MARNIVFVYRGYHFLCSAEKDGPGRFRPVVVRDLGWPSGQHVPLMNDADLCRTEAEALRHAERQAIQWADSRSVLHESWIAGTPTPAGAALQHSAARAE